jgi:hypothetical protein
MIDKDFWGGAAACLLLLAMYCRGSVVVASILSYPALRGIPLILGGVMDSDMPKTREGRAKAAIVNGAIWVGVISFLPAMSLLTINRTAIDTSHLLAAIQVVLAVAWTAWLARWTKRRTRSLSRTTADSEVAPPSASAPAAPRPGRYRRP